MKEKANFSTFGLKTEVVEALFALGLKKALAVQQEFIPLAMKGKNVVLTSKTGSGKTLAYLLGFVGKINKKLGIQMVVLVPTRELAIQVGKELQRICDILGLHVGVLYGGREIAGDTRTTSKKNHIIVGTPGRLIQHVNNKSIKVGDVAYIVYDESDQMFDDGFYDECVYMKSRISKNAQIILASAILTEKVNRFMSEEIVQYEFLQVGEQIPEGIVQEKVLCAIPDKNAFLLKFFTTRAVKRTLIFCNTIARTEEICEFLVTHGYKAKPIHGHLRQDERTNNLNLLKQGRVKILVATDVAARGLHIPDVDIVINYDAPRRAEFYVNRIGRTGRNEKKGYSLIMICPEDVERFAGIEQQYDLKVRLLE